MLDNDVDIFTSFGFRSPVFSGQIEIGLKFLPVWLLILIFVVLGLWRVGLRFAIFTLLSLLLIDNTHFWDQTVVTLGLTFSSTLISLAFGIPLGIWAARNKTVATIVRPILDFMQTMPAFRSEERRVGKECVQYV